MNYLQLSQELARKAGVSGQPASVTGQKGEMLRLVNWVNQAWNDIQLNNPRWPFLWKRDTFPIYADQAAYELPADLRELALGEVEYLNPASGKWGFVSPMTFTEFDRLYRHATVVNAPQVVTLTPESKLQFYPIPNLNSQAQITYWSTPQVLSANTDTPLLPAHFHQMIVWLALKYYGEYEQDMEVAQVANVEFQKLFTACSNELLPDLSFDKEFY